MTNTIINPKTGRAVNRYGKIGQQVLNNRRRQYGGSKKRSARRNSRGKTLRRNSRNKIGGGYNQNAWINSVMKARRELGIEGFHPVRKGTPLYKRAKQIQSGGVWRVRRGTKAAEPPDLGPCWAKKRMLAGQGPSETQDCVAFCNFWAPADDGKGATPTGERPGLDEDNTECLTSCRCGEEE